MIRRVIKIDEGKCDGCGLCAEACLEGAIGIVDGKAKLLRDDYCDGLGNCLPACPAGAISFEEREADAYDEEAVKRLAKQPKKQKFQASPAESFVESELRQWPIQIKLAPVKAPYFNQAGLLIAADCAAYAYGGFHADFMRDKITLIGCPKLDEVDYSEKLTEIISQNSIESVTVARMEVPCCGGIERAVTAALKNSGKKIPGRAVTISAAGEILKEAEIS
ncbi:MAG: 4Fe-4S binding protein [Clostridiales bacterium]|nr:4Fe-4S binding protein [Clostridiales bacterium]